MASSLASDAVKLADQPFVSNSPWARLTEVTLPLTGLPNERPPKPQPDSSLKADLLERSWQMALPNEKPETFLRKELQRGGQQNAAGTHQRSVLIIEDNADNLLFAQYAVEHLGYRATAMKSGQGAVATAMTCLPDIILLDILLERINGIDVFRQLRKHEAIAHIPVIAVTALARPCDYESIMTAGFSDYLLKPYMIDDLQRMLSRHLPA